MKIFLTIIAIWFGGCFFWISSVSAETASLRLITSPLPLSLTTEPGQSITTELRIKNDGTSEERLKITPMSFRAYEDTGKPELLEEKEEHLQWVSFSEPTFTVAPGEWKTITATFRVPETAAFGYYYAFVFSRASENQAVVQGETALVGGTATLVLLEARVPDAKREVTLTQFSTPHTFYEFLPVEFRVQLKNTGTVHVAPHGNIFIERGGQDVALLDVNASQGNILPNSTRTFETSWSDGFPVYEKTVVEGKTVLDEAGQPQQTLTWNFQDAHKLRFGKYTANLVLIYYDGTRDIPLESTVSFWVIPWRGMGIALVAILFFLIGMKSTLAKLWRTLRALKRK